jgi:OOP family OmpA-OmpF porin
MREEQAARPTDAAPAGPAAVTSAPNGLPDATPDDGLASLRAILLGPEQRRMAALQARLEDPARRAEEIGAVLPRVLVQHAQDPGFTRALAPSIEKAITTSVRKNPRPLADALFPIMGPAIRKAVSAALAGMVESLERTLELSVSRRAIQWRLEALRTGRPFAEVVLAKTLLYRVEQVFLIDRSTGLLLQHVQADVPGVRDADMVSGMLTAIRDFVKDSFQVAEGESLDSLEVGALRVQAVAGPHAVLAAVVRGTAPPDYRRTLEEALEAVHLRFGDALASFSGDAAALEGTRPILEGCLASQRTPDAAGRRPARGARVVFGLAALGAAVWLGSFVRADLRWRRYLDALRTQPGIVVLSSERSGGRFVVTGLRDPLAADPVPLLSDAGLSADDVVGRWTAYHALDPEIVLARAGSALSPPPGVTLSFAGGLLSSSGTPPASWIVEARRTAPLVAGVQRFDAAAAARAAAPHWIRALEGEDVLFVKGGTGLAAGQEGTVERLAAALRELEALAEAGGLRYRVELVGHTDEDGVPQSNVPLSRARAEVVRAAIAAAAADAVEVVTSGVGSTQPAAAGRTEADMQRNRRVTIRVTPLQG